MRKLGGSSFRDGRERKQKYVTYTLKINSFRETHSEIERKRRDRMKKEADFLQQQLNVNCRDRLSILQQGSKELTEFANKIGERDYIIATQEFNNLILENLKGFLIVISCDNGKILHIQLIDFDLIHFIDNSSELSSSALETCLQLSELELDSLAKDKLFQRNMILPMRINRHPANLISHENCVPSSDGSFEVKFIEFVGSICFENVDNYMDDSLYFSTGKPVFRALCREMEVSFSASKLNIDIRTPHFTCRHAPDNLTVKEVVGMPKFLLNLKAEEILGLKPNEFIHPITTNELFQWENCFKTGKIDLRFNFVDSKRRRFNYTIHHCST
ncbi:hypothetical protein Ciccas_001810 [Cichlidogyrus casuarinus]|uniref:Uncharacterized protein n=1 Tax=Cichlidogyrus casuarinus TaxID=1844966 RepID=A0ABD2QJB6_9PLAT